MKRALMFCFVTLTFISLSTYSQARKQRVRTAGDQIEFLLSKHKDAPYKELGEIIDVDSSIGVPGIADGKISDPYSTLKRCYLFMATTEGVQGENRKHSIGIYRDGKILWMSEQLPGSENYGYMSDEGFLAVKDINHMGKVDIIVFFSDGTNPPSGYFLWIFSWDGKQGKCINECEKSGETSIASTGAFEVEDVDGDGIDEILSYDTDLNVNAVYHWNGDLYTRRSKNYRPKR